MVEGAESRMGGPILSTNSSLERLKALDGISGLQHQLDEAKQLCTHRVRADMILKWILEKLKNSSEARSNSETWKTLILTLRLLSPERAGSLLATSNLFGIIKDSLTENTGFSDQLEVLSDLFTFLFQLSSGSDGFSVKAVLSSPALDVATFLGAWFKAVVKYYDDDYPTLSAWKLYIEVAFQVWAMRKHSADENILFADNCLVPLTKLLSIASSDPVLFNGVSDTEFVSRKKRRRGVPGDWKHSDIDLLELHLAKHVFLPARKSLFQAQSQAKSQPRDVNKDKTSYHQSAATIERLLGSIESSVNNVAAEESRQLVSCLASLLDVSLRCVHMETPKQRSAEKIWIEHLWHEFYRLVCRIPTQNASPSLLEMLSVIESRKVSLSQEALREVVKRSVGLYGSLDESIDWDVLAKVIALDAGIFANAQAAEPLFTAITAHFLGRDFLETDRVDTLLPHSDAWAHTIVMPVMEAFAKARDLPVFIRLWGEQLTRDGHDEKTSVWTDLDAAFSPLVEDSLADAQILQLFASQYNTFDSACRQENGAIQQVKLNATIVILNALLRGIKSEAVLNQILPDLERLVILPPAATAKIVSPFHEWRYWAMVTRAFSLWFPLWATQQSDIDAITKWGADALASSAMTAAFTAMQAYHRVQDFRQEAQFDGSSNASLDGHDAFDPARFVLCLCHYLCGYPTLQEICAAKVDSLFKALRISDLPAVLCYSGLIKSMDEDALRVLLKICIDRETSIRSPRISTLLALIASEISQGRTHLAEPMLEALLPIFDTESKAERHMTGNSVIETLIEMPPTFFSRPQRERLLNALTSATWASGTPSAEVMNQRRLALVIKLVRTANPTCNLSTDPAALSGIAHRLFKASDTQQTLEERPVTLLYLKELTRQVLSHLIATQDQQRSHDVLMSFSAQVVKDFGNFSKLKWSRNESYRFSLSMSALEELEKGCKLSLKDQMAHREPKWAKKLIESLMAKVTDILPGLLDARDLRPDSDEVAFPDVFDALLSLPLAYFDLGGLPKGEVLKPCVRFLQSTLQPGYAESLKLEYQEPPFSRPIARIVRLVLVRCYCILVSYSSGAVDPEALGLAEDLLQLELPPLEHEKVRRAFEKGVESLPHDYQERQARRLFVDEGQLTRAGLLLLPICIKKIEKELWEASPDSRSGKMLHQILNNSLHTTDLVIFTRSMQCIDTILKEKPFLANQHALETILINLPRLARHEQNPAAAYELATQVFSTLFLSHRSRLQGRYHLVMRALQQLLSQLFTSTDHSSARRSRPTHALTATHAAAFSRLLTLLCEPPQQRRQTSTADGLILVDAARREQAHAGKHVPVVLHQFCVQVLHGRLTSEGMREALNPGLWAVIEAMEMHETHGVRVLSTSMDENERIVLRGIYEEWRRFGKWKGG